MSYRPLRRHRWDTSRNYGTGVCGNVGMIAVDGDTDCLLCLCRMGLYVPLTKLKEHQIMTRLCSNPLSP